MLLSGLGSRVVEKFGLAVLGITVSGLYKGSDRLQVWWLRAVRFGFRVEDRRVYDVAGVGIQGPVDLMPSESAGMSYGCGSQTETSCTYHGTAAEHLHIG